MSIFTLRKYFFENIKHIIKRIYYSIIYFFNQIFNKNILPCGWLESLKGEIKRALISLDFESLLLYSNAVWSYRIKSLLGPKKITNVSLDLNKMINWGGEL
jgi:hypothetical protein